MYETDELDGLSQEELARLRVAVQREKQAIQEEKRRAQWQAEQATLESAFQERLKAIQRGDVESIYRLRKEFRDRGLGSEHTASDRAEQERARLAEQERRSAPAYQAQSNDLLAEYQAMIKNAPEGTTRAKFLFDAKLAIRRKAEAANIPSPV